jgi:hypothetical protein
LAVFTCLAVRAEPVRFELEQISGFDEPNTETLGLGQTFNELGEVVGIAEDSELVPRGFRCASSLESLQCRVR